MKIKRFYQLFALFTALFLLQSCEKETCNPGGNYPGGIFVLNEGNFQLGNASVSYFDPGAGRVEGGIFSVSNCGLVLGDALQSMLVHETKGFMVVNNSQKLVVVNLPSFEWAWTITGLNSPRYMAIAANKGFVTDWLSNTVAVIDLNNHVITNRINVGVSPEKILAYNGKLYVANGAFGVDNTVSVIDPTTETVEATITVGLGATDLVADMNGKLWVLSSGLADWNDPTNDVGGSLARINPLSNSLEQTFNFDKNDHPSKIEINPEGDKLYIVNGALYEMWITDGALPHNTFSDKFFYGIGIDPATGMVYAADPLDYSQRGYFFRFQSNGFLIDSFLVDMIPNGFVFQ